MDHAEFSSEFDVLYNNIMSNAAPGLNEYEKSVLLTKAQEEIIKNHFEPTGNRYGKGFDDSPKRQIDFSEIIRVGDGVLSPGTPSITFDSRAKVYTLPSDLFLITNEALKTDRGVRQIIPLSYSDYTMLMSKPYKAPMRYQAWRLITTSVNDITVEVIVPSGEVITEYKVKYVKAPVPIITADLTDYNQTIQGISTISECELNPILHREILQRAVELAKAFYQGDLQASVELGQRSE